MYGEAAMKRFCDRGLINNPPHIYAMAEEAIRKARYGGGSQVRRTPPPAAPAGAPRAPEGRPHTEAWPCAGLDRVGAPSARGDAAGRRRRC